MNYFIIKTDHSTGGKATSVVRLDSITSGVLSTMNGSAFLLLDQTFDVGPQYTARTTI